MKKKYKKIKQKYNQLEKDLQKPEVVNNQEKLKEKSQKYSELKESYEKIIELEETNQSIANTEEMIEESDEEMKAMAQEELKELKNKKADLEEKLVKLTRPTDPMDKKNAIVEIRAGAGGDEAALFASELARMYMRYAEDKGWSVSVISQNKSDLGGYKEIIFSVEGSKVYKDLKYEMGVHRVQRVPETEKSGRVHTSTASVAVLPEVKDAEVEIDEGDLRIDTYSASKNGGQSVNTTNSAVRITHEPTDIVVQCQDEKSQRQNKNKAMEILRARIFDKKQQERQEKLEKKRQNQIGSGDRSEKIRTYNFPQDRITDHRIEQNWSNIEEVMDGNLDEIIEQLREARYEELDSMEV